MTVYDLWKPITNFQPEYVSLNSSLVITLTSSGKKIKKAEASSCSFLIWAWEGKKVISSIQLQSNGLTFSFDWKYKLKSSWWKGLIIQCNPKRKEQWLKLEHSSPCLNVAYKSLLHRGARHLEWNNEKVNDKKVKTKLTR